MSVSFPLLSLADELVLAIIQECTDDLESLRCLARTCHHLQLLTEPFLYRSIFLRTGKQALQLAQSIGTHPERVFAIQCVDMRCSHRRGDGIKTLIPLLKDFKNLREWTIESPFCNYGYWRETAAATWVEDDMEEFYTILKLASPLNTITAQPKVLPLLKSFTLHSHGISDRYYNLGRLGVLFLHPSLRNIHLSCAEIGDGLDFLRAYPASTPLTSLVLDECDISTAGLSHILSVPRGLKQLTISESAHHSDHDNKFQQIGEQPIEIFAALEPQKHSLQFLKHTCRASIEGVDEGSSRPICFADTAGLFNFEALTNIEVSINSVFKRALEAHLGPRDLKSIRLVDVSGSILDNPETAIDTHALMRYRHLQDFDLIHSTREEELLVAEMWGHGRLEKVHKFTRLLQACNINLQVYIEMHGTLFPPYLYGETVPKPSLAFPSDWCNPRSNIEDGGGNDGKISKGDVDNLMERTQQIIEEYNGRVEADRSSFSLTFS
ncbi:hypothetical protein AOQ84DRAFT_393100 [Glonium stellatum]|uniref:F-box domain-containing protein n=1 Tax=Glonium stellatum TaxID=574774 RepID=A0A8E2EQ03_9PEZI|nr:hypothetical protein AOQ84DRAFT_393100 [Glonium stellatum]